MSEPDSKYSAASIAKVAIAIVLLGVAIFLAARHLGRNTQAAATVVWYYDLGSGKLFSHAERVPPIDAPSGKFEGGQSGVLAAVYSCGACSDESKRFVAWVVNAKPGEKPMLEKAFVPEQVSAGVGARLTFLQGNSPDSWEMKLPGDAAWMPLTGKMAEGVQAAALGRCGKGVEARECAGPASP